jgi:formylglycine-generating enzyme required for sulfatase activity
MNEHQRKLEDRIQDAWALGGRDPRIRIDPPLEGMVEVPASERMGAYRIGRYPVTTMEYAAFIADGGYGDEMLWSEFGWSWVQRHRIGFPRYWRNHRISWPNGAVTGVNYFEASAYCAWLTQRNQGLVFRLPSALEWDRAAHGDDQIFKSIAAIARREFTRARQLRSAPGQTGQARPRGDRLRAAAAGIQPEGPVPADEELREADLRERVDEVQQLVRRIEAGLAPHQEELDQRVAEPVGVFAGNRLGIYDLFGGPWQWCNTSMALVSSTEAEFEDLTSDPDAHSGIPIVVKGGAMSGSYNPVWMLIGGWFDPLVRFHRLGFRVTCRPANR